MYACFDPEWIFDLETYSIKTSFVRIDKSYFGVESSQQKANKKAQKSKLSKVNQCFEGKPYISPSTLIAKERKKIKAAYGFTDETIMKTLDYLFNVKKLNKGFESIGLVNPQNVEEARKYFEEKKKKEEKLREAEQTRIEKIVVPVKKKERKVELIDIDALLEEDE
jgi:hypothetical protein